MKSKKQISAFFESNKFSSLEDCQLISVYCQQNSGFTPTELPVFDEPGDINAQMFLDWFRDGFGIGDIVLDGETGSFCMICSSSVSEVMVCASCSKDRWKILDEPIAISNPTHIDEQTSDSLVFLLSSQGYEFDYEKKNIRKKYIPEVNERVEFSKGDFRGLGVVRSINPAANTIEFYCYFIYNNKEIGYSMHESGICDVMSYQFNPMTVVALRRMNRELNRFGKLWNDKLHRIEPVEVMAKKGELYWYISDKMKIVTDREKNTPTSRFRYIAGNYFTSYEEALEVCGLLNEILRDRLAR